MHVPEIFTELLIDLVGIVFLKVDLLQSRDCG